MPAQIPVDSTAGAAFIGHLLSTLIFGVTCLQAYEYYTVNASGDTRLLRYFVATVIVLDVVHLCCVTHALYWYLVTNFGDYNTLAHIVWSIEVQVGVADMITCMMQGFFAFRIYILSERKNWWLPALVLCCGLALVGTAIGFILAGFRWPLHAQTSHQIPWAIGGLTAELMGDVLMTAGLSYYLLRIKADFNSTNRAVTLLVTYTLNTGLLTTIFTIVTLAMFVKTCETSLLYTPFFFILARLYSCSFLSTLNSRKRIRKAMSQLGAEGSYVLPAGGGGNDGQYTPRAVEIFITSTKDVN